MSNNIIDITTTEIATPNSAQFLSFDKEKVQPITLGQLSRTHKENDVYGNPLRGIYHFDMLGQVIDMGKSMGYDIDVYDLFAAQNKDRNTPGVVLLPQVEERYGKNAVEAHILRRVFANIRIKDFDDAETTTNLSVAFHQKGIQAGFGPNVIICHNQCMLSADKYVATYGEKGKGRNSEQFTPYQILDVIKSWLIDARQIVVTEREKIERMKNIEVGVDQMLLIIGMLTAIRVKCDTEHKSIRLNETYPLNQAQITKFTEALLLKSQTTGGKVTAWDIYNAATDLYKADTMDIPVILPQNMAMVKFLNERFCLS